MLKINPFSGSKTMYFGIFFDECGFSTIIHLGSPKSKCTSWSKDGIDTANVCQLLSRTQDRHHSSTVPSCWQCLNTVPASFAVPPSRQLRGSELVLEMKPSVSFRTHHHHHHLILHKHILPLLKLVHTLTIGTYVNVYKVYFFFLQKILNL